VQSYHSVIVFFRTMCIAMLISSVLFGVLLLERAVRHFEDSNSNQLPLAPYTAVVAAQGDVWAGSKMMVRSIEEKVIEFWRFGN